VVHNKKTQWGLELSVLICGRVLIQHTRGGYGVKHNIRDVLFSKITRLIGTPFPQKVQ